MKAAWLLPAFLLGAGAGAGGMKVLAKKGEDPDVAKAASLNNGWGDLSQRAQFGCGEMIRVLRTSMSGSRSSPREGMAFAFIVKGDEAALIEECGTALGPGLGRCAEYSLGSEHGIDCAQRYMSAALKDFLLVKCLQGIGLDVHLSMTPSQIYETLMNMDRTGKTPAEFTECFAAFGGTGQ